MDIFVPLFKVDAAKREVHGVMAEEKKDKTGEVFDYTSSKPYVKAWVEELQRASGGKSYGNVRGQHSKVAAGKLVGITFDDAAKCIPIVAKIVDDNEWQKVLEGVYTGFSIGGSYVKKWDDGGATRYTAKPSEVSIVDNPAMYGATFSLVKADGTFEHRAFAGAPSDGMAKLRDSLAELGRVVDAYVARRAAPQPARFPQGEETGTVLKFVAGMPGGLMLEPNAADLAEASRQESVFVTKTASGEAVAQAELHKALANGKPVTSPNYVRGDDGLEKGAPSKFSTVETVAPGVQLHHHTLRAPNAERASTAAPAEHRPFQPGGETDMTKAHDAVNHALANGKRV